MPTRSPAWLVVALGTLLCGGGHAGSAEEGASSAPAPPQPSAQASSDSSPAVPALLPSGLLVFVDPATGRILDRPLPEQLAALRALRVAQAARIGTEEERQRQLDALPRYAVPGGFGVDVEGHFLSALTVVRGPDGVLRFGCTDAQHDGHDHPPVAGTTGVAQAPPER